LCRGLALAHVTHLWGLQVSRDWEPSSATIAK
jgi:hypothetical protein